MKIPIMTIDAFTDNAFAGNPAAVCLLEGLRDENWMQDLAGEMNLSETAFVAPRDTGFYLRWFTPESEVDLCGHATLASAHALWETGRLDPGTPAEFHTRSGILKVEQVDGSYQMDFPREAPETAAPPPGLLEALGVEAVWTGRNRMDLVVEVENEDVVREIYPDFTKLRRIETRGTIVTSKSEMEGVDFVSRFFCPGLGVNEDPVNGSSHCCLGPYWQIRLGKTELNAVQLSKRGGVLKVEVQGNRVLITGKAITVIRGELCAKAV